MSDTDNTTNNNSDGRRPTSSGAGASSGSETGKVKQSFSHGRSKMVVVEKKRGKRLTTPGSSPAPGGAGGGAAKSGDGPKRSTRDNRGGGGRRGGKSADAGKTLSAEEAARRARALDMARKAQEERLRRDAEEASRKEAERAAAEEARVKAEAEEAVRKAEEEAARKVAEEAERIAEEEARKQRTAAEQRAYEERKRAEAETARKAEEEARSARRAHEDALDAARKAKEAETAPRGRKIVDDGPRVGSAVDVSGLVNLAGPKIIKRADPVEVAKAKKDAADAKAAAVQARSRPKPTSADAAPPPMHSDRSGPSRDDADRKPRSSGRGGDNKRRSGRLTINQALSGEEGGRQRSLASMRRRQEKDRRKAMSSGPAVKVIRDVQIPDAITVQELANRMSERAADVIKSLMKMDMMLTITQSIDADTAQLVVEEFGHRFTRVSESAIEDNLIGDDDRDEDLAPRAPVVTIMGHVDHGKTSLLDALRDANVVSGEAGGITQHIGAYQVNTKNGVVTFIDTPGHAAFTSMRARGANVTDIVILVVAANDSVMPQTIEAIAHAKAAGAPMIVAINKVDLPNVDPNTVRTELLQHDVQVEEMGGEVITVEVSALKKMGLDALLESILLQAEILELKANPDRPGEGVVVEAKLDVGRGPVATVLVQRGTLRVGDVFVVGEQWGKVRALVDDHGKRIKEAGPSAPVEVLGLNGAPEAGDTLVVVENEATAREVAEYRSRVAKDKAAAQGSKSGASLDQLLANVKAEENVKYLPVVIKADVQGSTEAIVQALDKVGNDEVKVRVLHSGVGAITEADVTLAEASGAPIIGFNVRANAPARDSANQKNLEIRYYSIIYDLVDDIKSAASGLLSPEVKETFIGYAEILQVFKVTGVGNVAGCRVTEGLARRSAGVRLLRDNVVIHEGTLKTLKRFKDEVKEVHGGQECGMAFERYEDIREKDVIEIFEREEIARTL